MSFFEKDPEAYEIELRKAKSDLSDAEQKLRIANRRAELYKEFGYAVAIAERWVRRPSLVQAPDLTLEESEALTMAKALLRAIAKLTEVG